MYIFHLKLTSNWCTVLYIVQYACINQAEANNIEIWIDSPMLVTAPIHFHNEFIIKLQ